MLFPCCITLGKSFKEFFCLCDIVFCLCFVLCMGECQWNFRNKQEGFPHVSVFPPFFLHPNIKVQLRNTDKRLELKYSTVVMEIYQKYWTMSDLAVIRLNIIYIVKFAWEKIGWKKFLYLQLWNFYAFQTVWKKGSFLEANNLKICKQPWVGIASYSTSLNVSFAIWTQKPSFFF